MHVIFLQKKASCIRLLNKTGQAKSHAELRVRVKVEHIFRVTRHVWIRERAVATFQECTRNVCFECHGDFISGCRIPWSRV